MRWSLLALWLASSAFAEDLPIKVEMNRDIRPILSENCFFCHGPDARHRKADLRLDVEASVREAEVIVPGQPDKSELMQRLLSHQKFKKMPPPKSGKSLTPRQIALVRRWIEQGAKYQKHWSYVTPRRSPLPSVQNHAWPSNPIDRFILANLESKKRSPSPEADRVTLLRRLAFDLHGLPPSADEVERFKKDDLSSTIDRLLASPRFGERMAIYWLDLVRYASTVGYHGDQVHNIAPYRDYVIDAFNANMPFDQFTTEQLAGDLLPNATIDQRIASGYNRLLQTTHEGGAQDKEYLAKYAADRVRNFSGVWMGGTMGCAECHDHKYDPYTQKDFYSLVAFFADIQEKGYYRGSGNTNPTQRPPEISVLSRIDRQRVGELSKKEIARRKRKTMVTVSVKPRTIRILKRGDWMDTTGKIVEPAVPEFLPPLKVKGRRATRLDLARWLTSREHPQTARVFVNRLWYLFFGSGLCRSLADTGSQGEWPDHLALLDWLAVEFVESGWDVKHLVKLIVTSSTYRQSSRVTKEMRELDPQNRLFARQGRFRLPGEMIRDNALSVGGLLLHHYGGPSAKPYQPAGYYKHLNFPKRRYVSDQGEGQYRRGVHMHWQRQFLHPMLRAFDAPTREECTPARPVSNTPLAALTLLNDPTFVEAARGLAIRIVRLNKKDLDERLKQAWEMVLSRSPNAREKAVLRFLYAKAKATYEKNVNAAKELLSIGISPVPGDLDTIELASWTTVARALLNLNETITRN